MKVRHLRQSRQLSFAELAHETGMSVSYLNEIEKGKKYPKDDKISILANALQTTEADLLSIDLPAALAPVEDLLQSNFLNEIPLHLFGIDMAKVIEIIADAPMRVSAFISTLLDLSRNYALREENFYFGALRSYLELNNNHFDDLEEAVRQFSKKNNVSVGHAVTSNFLAGILEKKYDYKIVENGLLRYEALQNLRAVFVPKTRELLLNSHLSEEQRVFQFGKELGFNVLNLQERAYTSSLLKVQTFEEALNHFKAGYFSAALLINKENFVKDIDTFLKKTTWDGAFLVALLQKYRVTPETLFQRLTNVLPHHFGVDKLFFLRVIQHKKSGKFDLNKELHLNRRHHPHRNSLDEHYCRRWISVTLLKEFTQVDEINNIKFGIQRSKYFGTDDEYVCLTLARAGAKRNVSVTIGIMVDNDVRKKIAFLNDPAIPTRLVNTTCERCAMTDCTERAIEPTIIKKRNERQQMQAALKEILD
ncbi:MAG: hypothetical protein RL757_2830 [Bacteroidota bacterium]